MDPEADPPRYEISLDGDDPADVLVLDRVGGGIFLRGTIRGLQQIREMVDAANQARRSPPTVGPDDCKACEGTGRQSVADGPIAVTARKRDDAVGPEEVEAAWRTVKVAIWEWVAIGKDDDEAISDLELESRAKAELARLLARPGYDAGFAAGIEAAKDAVRNLKPGFTISLDTGALVDDPDGPWGVPSDFLAAIEKNTPPGADRNAGKASGEMGIDY